MTASTKPGQPMRAALFSRSALEQNLRVHARVAPDSALELRCDAQGLGLAEVSALARDVGFRFATHSPGCAGLSALQEAPEGLPVLTGWWDGGTAPVVTFSAQVISVKRVPAGSAVSYGYHYTTSSETTLALISAGFADGVPRSASGRAQVSLGGINAPIAGRIAMDQCVVDCGDLPVSVGEAAVLWGAQPTLGQWSQWSGRSEGAILSHLGDRVVKTWQ